MLKGMFCMRLHTAGMVIGWLGSVGGFLLIVLLSLVMGNADYIAERITERDPMAQEDVHKMIILLCSIALAIIALCFICSNMLIIGTMKNRHLFLMPWLINSGIFHVIGIILNLAYLGMIASTGNLFLVLVFLIFAGLATALNVYVYYTVYSLFHHIRAIREEKRAKIVQNEGNHQADTYPNYVKI